MSKPIEVRDGRRPGHFWADSKLIRRDGAALGVYGIAVYCALCTYADNKENTAYPSVASIARIIGCSPRKVRSCLGQLKEMGWLHVEPRHAKNAEGKRIHLTNIYYLLPTPKGAAQDAQGVMHVMHNSAAQDADELHSDNYTQETTIAPDGAGDGSGLDKKQSATPSVAGKKQRKRNIAFEHVAAKLFSATRSEEYGVVAARVGKVLKSLKTLECGMAELDAACETFRAKYPGASLPRDNEKVATMVLEHRQRARQSVATAAEVETKRTMGIYPEANDYWPQGGNGDNKS